MADEPSLFNRGLLTGLFKGLVVGLFMGAIVAAGAVLIAGGGFAALPVAASAVWSAVAGGGGWAAVTGAGIGGLKAGVIAGAVTAGLITASKTFGEAAQVRNDQRMVQNHLRRQQEKTAGAGQGNGHELEAPAQGAVIEHEAPEAEQGAAMNYRNDHAQRVRESAGTESPSLAAAGRR